MTLFFLGRTGAGSVEIESGAAEQKQLIASATHTETTKTNVKLTNNITDFETFFL